MKIKKIILALIIISLVFVSCGGKKSNSQDDKDQQDTQNREAAQSQSGPVDLEALQEEMVQLYADYQAGKVSLEDYSKRAEKISELMMSGLTSEMSDQNDSSSGYSMPKEKKYIAEKYRGDFYQGEEGRWSVIRIEESYLGVGSLINIPGFIENSWNFDPEWPAAWTEGNELIVIVPMSTLVTKIGYFENNSTLVIVAEDNSFIPYLAGAYIKH